MIRGPVLRIYQIPPKKKNVKLVGAFRERERETNIQGCGRMTTSSNLSTSTMTRSPISPQAADVYQTPLLLNV